MGYHPLDSNDKRAKRVLELFERVEQTARNTQIECTFTLAATSLLLSQTLDASRRELNVDTPDNEAMEIRDAERQVEQLPEHLRAPAIEWLGSWRPNSPRAEGAPDRTVDQWRWVKKYRPSDSNATLGEELVRAVAPGSPGAESLPKSVSKRRLLRLIRNGIMHGSCWWTPDPRKRIDGKPVIDGVVIASLTNPARCDRCNQMLEDREAMDANQRKYDIVWVQVSALNRYIKKWAETLAKAGADQGELEGAAHHYRLGQR